MEQVNPEAVTAQDGEASFILQLRPAAPPEADAEALAAQIDQFVSLYLASAGLDEARFAPLEPLTWALSALPGEAARIEAIRADLSETLFGRADGDHVRLVQQPPAEQEAEPAAGPVRDDPFDGWEPAHSSAVTRAAMDDASDILDLDAPDLDIIDSDIVEVDAWTLSDTDPFGEASERFDVRSTADLDPRPAGDEDEQGSDLSADDPSADAGIAAELAAFRAEMRNIAAGIPDAEGSKALEQFRSELDSITGALGQRVDGAAQRIETAADRVADSVAHLPDAERMAGALERAEASARLMDTSVRDAVDALTAALRAMNGAAPDVETEADTGA
jgi:hypothetical protein